MRWYRFLLIVEGLDDEREEQLLRDRILPIEDLHVLVMAVEKYGQYFPVDT
jgi:hypothetical protein